MSMFARHLDLAVLVVALPIFLLTELPFLGYVVGAGCYVGQLLLAIYMRRRAELAERTSTKVGLLVGSTVGRGWLVALVIFGAGFFLGHSVGLAAAVLFLMAFSFYFVTSLILSSDKRLAT